MEITRYVSELILNEFYDDISFPIEHLIFTNARALKDDKHNIPIKIIIPEQKEK